MIQSSSYTMPMRCRMYDAQDASITEVVVTDLIKRFVDIPDEGACVDLWASVQGAEDPVAACYLEPIRPTRVAQHCLVEDVVWHLALANGLPPTKVRARFHRDRTVHVTPPAYARDAIVDLVRGIEIQAREFHRQYRTNLLAWAEDKVRTAMRDIERVSGRCAVVALPAPIPYLLSDPERDDFVKGWTTEPFLGLEVVDTAPPLLAAVYTNQYVGRFALVDL